MDECAYKMSSFTPWMALGRVSFIKGTNIKSKQFTRSATCVGICGEINKLLFLDHCSLNALLIWGKKSKVLWKLCVLCMRAHTRENEEKHRDKQKLAKQQAGIFPPQKSQIKLRSLSRCQLPQGREITHGSSASTRSKERNAFSFRSLILGEINKPKGQQSHLCPEQCLKQMPRT